MTISHVRHASPNEQRTISRQYWGFYNTLVIGGIYEFSSSFNLRSKRSFYGAIKHCVNMHPTLSYVVRDTETDSAYFERVPMLKLDHHIELFNDNHVNDAAYMEQSRADMSKIEAILPTILDRPWLPASDIPWWKIVVLPLSAIRSDEAKSRCFISFAFSHALGDGISALAFHRTFQEGIFHNVDKECLAVTTPQANFPPLFDTKQNFPITWTFLLAPLVAVLLPKSLASFLGLRASVSMVDTKTWTGSRMCFEPDSFNTRLRVIEIPGPVVKNALSVAKRNGTRLTGLLHQSIIRGFSLALPPEVAGNFVSGTAINMRRSVGKSDNEMGLYVNARFESHDRDDERLTPWSEEAWTSARAITERLAESAVTLQDQPVGLLRYVPSIKNWTKSKIGQERDCSYELSNLGAFEQVDSHDAVNGHWCKITHMIFTRPADAVGSPIGVNVASVKGSSMVITISWQSGALGMSAECESKVVDTLCEWLKDDLGNLR